MVSLENRSDYSFRINESQKLKAFYDLLLSKSLIKKSDDEISESDQIYFGIISSIISNDIASFKIYYEKKSKSHPSKDSPSPFVYDDCFVFCLIVGISKFSIDKSWIKEIISIRNRNSITITFENILNENYFSKSNQLEVVLMYFHLCNPSLITNELLNDTYQRIIETADLFNGKSDFLIICAIRSYDNIIVRKDSQAGSYLNLLMSFELRFLNRIKYLAWLVRTALLISLIYIIIVLISFFPVIKTFFDTFGTIVTLFGVFGISQLGNIFPFVIKTSNVLLLYAFGYPNELKRRNSIKEKGCL